MFEKLSGCDANAVLGATCTFHMHLSIPITKSCFAYLHTTMKSSRNQKVLSITPQCCHHTEKRSLDFGSFGLLSFGLGRYRHVMIGKSSFKVAETFFLSTHFP
jgi:hypothetical protein